MQHLSRREFFKRAGAVAAGGALFLGGRFVPTAHAAPSTRSPLERSTFAQLIGENFSVRANAFKATTMQLVNVRAPRHVSSSHTDAWTRENCFAISLRSTTRLTQGTYAFHHPQLGRFDLFIVPGRHAPAPHTYDAVFHRRRA